MKTYAPILITTLCRYEHFQRCVKSLSECAHAEQSDLYIALDYPSAESHWLGYKRILESISLIEGFRRVHLIKRDRNFGAFANFEDAINLLFENHSTCIFTEDDNIFSNNFLHYINLCLSRFESSREIFAINGYNYPIEMPHQYRDNIYLWEGFSAWGFGMWRDRWQSISRELINENCFELVVRFLLEWKNIRLLNSCASHYTPALLRMIAIKEIHLDALISMHVIKNNMLCVFPVVSKVRNYGHDGTGVNCTASARDVYDNQPIDREVGFHLQEEKIAPNQAIRAALKQHFKRRLVGQIKALFLLLRLHASRKKFKSGNA